MAANELTTRLALGHGENALSALHQDDMSAFRLWAETAGSGSAHTRDAYLRESHRFAIWLHEAGLTADSLRVDHIQHYIDLLSDPPPEWRRPKKVRRNETLLSTQLFTGPLSERSIRHSINILGALFDWLLQARYLSFNPFALAPKIHVPIDEQQQRFLDPDCWEYLQHWLDAGNAAMPINSPKLIRARWLIYLLYYTGLRRSEVAQARMCDFMKRKAYWQLRVLGKGNKIRYVTVGSVLLYELQIYREALNLARYPSQMDTEPLIGSLGAMRSHKWQTLTPRAIGLMVEQVFAQAALDCAHQDIAEQLNAASTHWMRHTYGTHRTYAGASLQTTQAELGHSDIKSTTIYSKTSDVQRINDVEKLEKMQN